MEVGVAAFKRAYHSGRMPPCNIDVLGEVKNGNYLQRATPMLLGLRKMRRLIKSADIVYAFGGDMALFCLLAGAGLQRPVVIEVGDVRAVQTRPGIRGKLFRSLDRYLTSRCKLLIVTSPAFAKYYYRDWIGVETPSLAIENKVDNQVALAAKSSKRLTSSNERPLKDRAMRIGYFGLLRDSWSWEVLLDLARSHPSRFHVHLAGLCPTKERLEEIRDMPNVTYFGEYRSPGDLPGLYNNIDMTWACYPPIRQDDWNFKWARPNRFYESCMFGRPTFTREGCQDAFDVKHYRIGKIVHGVVATDVTEEIASITYEQWQCWANAMRQLPDNLYTLTTEACELNAKLVAIGGGGRPTNNRGRLRR
ncbi:hypothetical protein CA85_50890 [Allorhodopirellula solitaria]|uniref:Glycosyltransferase subfamily 4-like N-terminal domain-containing protein n=2 Tax=Allorhodopirellula solitaria TaxID=2527987 RepID=A0A5C5WPS2_9BACT|nr:hypothetical protein CA85_50890 [Allorhodopirellula solitaria]